MTHEELLAEIDAQIAISYAGSGFSEYAANGTKCEQALRAVVELHKPHDLYIHSCSGCFEEENMFSDYPCSTIQAIEKELK